MNRENLNRPFELLMLIRDEHLDSVSDFHHLCAYLTTCYGFSFDGLLKGLVELNLLAVSDSGKLTVTDQLRRLIRHLGVGLNHLAEYSPDAVVASSVFGRPVHPEDVPDLFVVMPFEESLQFIYEDHIRKVAASHDLTVARGDDLFGTNLVASDVWNAINACRIVIADCTGRNGNVFYEIGIAHTIGKPVILISQSMDDIPFDIQHHRALVYQTTPEGLRNLEKNLSDALRSTQNRPRCLHDVLRELIWKR